MEAAEPERSTQGVRNQGFSLRAGGQLPAGKTQQQPRFEPCCPNPGVNGNDNNHQPKTRFEILSVHGRKCLSSPNHIKSPDPCAFNMYIK